jgi:hypothetical protein
MPPSPPRSVCAHCADVTRARCHHQRCNLTRVVHVSSQEKEVPVSGARASAVRVCVVVQLISQSAACPLPRPRTLSCLPTLCCALVCAISTSQTALQRLPESPLVARSLCVVSFALNMSPACHKETLGADCSPIAHSQPTRVSCAPPSLLTPHLHPPTHPSLPTLHQ